VSQSPRLSLAQDVPQHIVRLRPRKKHAASIIAAAQTSRTHPSGGVPTRRLPQQPHSCVGRHPLRLGTRDWTTPCRVHHTVTCQSRCRPSSSALAPTTKASCLRTLSRRRRLRAPAQAITSHHPCAQTITSSQTLHRQHVRSHCQAQSSLLTPDAAAITCHPPADECGLLIAKRNPSLLSWLRHHDAATECAEPPRRAKSQRETQELFLPPLANLQGNSTPRPARAQGASLLRRLLSGLPGSSSHNRAAPSSLRWLLLLSEAMRRRTSHLLPTTRPGRRRTSRGSGGRARPNPPEGGKGAPPPPAAVIAGRTGFRWPTQAAAWTGDAAAAGRWLGF
jgi:hypothetical protein